MNSKNLRALIVDDDEDDVFLICDTISEIDDTNYATEVVHCPQKALTLLKQEEFDVVLCDFMMGATSGLDFIESIRTEGIEVPVILLTGLGDRSLDHAALAAGASDFLCKDALTPDNVDRAIRYSIANLERQRLFHTVLNSVEAAVVVLDSDRMPVLWNRQFLELSTAHAPLHGAQAVEMLASVVSTDKETFSVGERIFEKKTSQLPNASTVIMLHDVTEHVEALRAREEASRRAAHLAMYCSLTGLPNRNAFTARLNEEISRAAQNGERFYLLNLDLNRFKEVNDVYGHAVGDQLLAQVCQRMAACMGDGDYIARMGGDEFVALQLGSGEVGRIPDLARRIAAAVNGSYSIGEILLHTGISIGVAVFPDHGLTAEELMSRADTAMYRAKKDPHNPICSYDEAMDRFLQETRFLAQELKKAVNDNTIGLHYQPQAGVADGRIVGFEALARWQHARLGNIPPSRFIPIAEDHGLIEPLTTNILDQACTVAAQWDNPMKVAVNISPIQIKHSNLVELIHSVLFKTGLPSNRLELEVTESVLIDDFDRALHVIRGLKNIGVSVALDDFGTGHSSLSTLISFPFDKIKIDRSFTEIVETSPKAAEVVKAVIGLGHTLDFRITAEGVQTPGQVSFLTDLKCHEMQGYLIGKPMPANAIGDLLRNPGPMAERARCA